MYEAVSSAQKAGASTQAIKDFSSNIMNNHAGTMKDKFRSIYEFAKNTAATGEGKIDDFQFAGVQSLSTGDMAGMDTQRLESFLTRDETGKITGFDSNFTKDKDKTQLAQLAQDALADEHLSKELSGKQREALENIVSTYGKSGLPTLKPSKGSASINIDHSQPQIITEDVEAQFKNLTNPQPQHQPQQQPLVSQPNNNNNNNGQGPKIILT
jgi:hypothetical protein